MNIPRTLRLLLILMTCALARNAFGQVDVADQQYEPLNPPQSFVNVVDFTPIGQGFTPTLDSLSFVDLYFEVSIEAGSPGVLSLEINSQSITGAVLGVSAPVTLAPGFFGMTTFTFANPVAVEPGSLDFIQIVQSSGDELVGIGSPNAPPYQTYPGGPYIVQGSPEPDGVMWFSEGITTVPEPSVTVLPGAGAALVVIRRRTAKQNLPNRKHRTSNAQHRTKETDGTDGAPGAPGIAGRRAAQRHRQYAPARRCHERQIGCAERGGQGDDCDAVCGCAKWGVETVKR